MPIEIQDPWLGFLREVDGALRQEVEIHCLGGFVLRVMYDLPRYTADVDFIEIQPVSAFADLEAIGGHESDLAKRHGLHFQFVGIAEYPEGYLGRVIDITPAGLRKLRLQALEVHDIVLAKVGRNSPRDREDVKFLAGRGILDPQLLKERFESELLPYVLKERDARLTMELWLDEFFGLKP